MLDFQLRVVEELLLKLSGDTCTIFHYLTSKFKELPDTKFTEGSFLI